MKLTESELFLDEREASGIEARDLLPCPFCGGSAHFIVECSYARGATRGWKFAIGCTKCGVTSPETNYALEVQLGNLGQLTRVMDEREQAVEAWNRRV